MVTVSGTFVVIAIGLLWSPAVGALSILGIVLAVTPMVLFTASIVNNSAIETTAGLAFAAALLRLCRGQAVNSFVWVTIVLAGTTLVLSRSTGVLWLGFDLIVIAALMGRDQLTRAVRTNRRWALGALGILALASVVNRLWELIYGPRVTQSGPVGTPWFRELTGALEQLPRLAEEWIGVFGWLDSFLPSPLLRMWQLMLITVIAGALIVGTRRERLAISMALVAGVASGIVLSATLRSGPFGGDVQARYLLPLLVLIPMISVEILGRHKVVLNRVFAPAVAGLVVISGAVHTLAWYMNARRHAVGVDGDVLFLAHPEWAPPLGWTLWVAVATLGGSLIALVASSARVEEPPEPSREAQ